MQLFKTVKSLQEHLHFLKTQKKEIGFVPTMGALHEGHLTLISEAQQHNDVVVCSIFVNPTQFNEIQDLKKYPRPIGQDTQALESMGCDILFLPETEEVYPPELTPVELDLEGLDEPMEGAKRPGHFAGVVQVVHRLLDIVQPHRLYMGQKDFQQYTIIAYMIGKLQLPVELIRVPIVREEDGLAMSSRNIRLSEAGRQLAPILHKVLLETQYYVQSQPIPKPQIAQQQAIEQLNEHGITEIDYFEIVDGNSLQKLQSFEETHYAVACATIRIDGVRLLDNIILMEA